MLDKYVFKIVFVIFMLISIESANSQSAFPRNNGDTANYEMQIDARGNFISGICMMVLDEDKIKCSIINEFGVSIIDFTYNTEKDKVKLHYVFKTLNKWYLRRVLRRDLKRIIAIMRIGGTSFVDSRHKLNFTFKINHDIEK